MNILPKKSWHVRTKANIERVRRDEEQAANEEKERQRRIALAEQEARTELLRKKAEGRHAIGNAEGRHAIGNAEGRHAIDDAELPSRKEEKQISLTSEGSRHINFFSNIEESERQGSNKEYDAEKKEEKEKQEKAIGLLTYLGQSAVEAQTSKPWYFKPPEKSIKSDSKKDDRISSQEFDVKTKSKLDPMNDMIKYLDRKRKADGSVDDLDSYHRRKKHKKHKEKERERTKSAGSSNDGKKTVEQLRAERLKREKEERLRQERLMAKVRGEKLPEEKPESVDDRSRRYNQQYNPDLARRPKKPRDYTDYRD